MILPGMVMLSLFKKHSTAILYVLFFILISEFFILIDFFDLTHEYTRTHEDWELDEYLSVIPVTLLLLSVHTFRNHQKLKKLYQTIQEQDEKLKTLNTSLEQKVDEKLKEIREKDKLILQQSRFAVMGEMFRMIAHHWRQPLNTVALLIGRLQIEQELDQLDQSTLDEICDQAEDVLQSLSQRINDFADLFHPHTPPQIFYLQESLDKAYVLIQEQINDQQTVLSCDSADSIQLFGVKNELDYVFVNLLINAHEIFQIKNPANRHIYIRIHQEKEEATIIIGDTGGGISPEHIEKIFDPYFSTKEDPSGAGVGLFITKNIIEKTFKGTLHAQNTQEGAEFVIALPLAIKNQLPIDAHTKNVTMP